MKKSVKTYVLLALVIGIWGIFLVRLIKTLYPEQKPLPSSKAIAYRSASSEQKETAELKLNYRDPFLGKTISTQTQKAKKQAVQKAKVVVNTLLDKVSYQGFIGGKKTKDHHFFISIEGTQELFQVGDVIKGIKLISGNASQVILRQNGVSKTIKITQ
ncbi:hypothetical protein [Aureicoccus marinus]|uniref:Uncharacterized protein n=1 Tax=Aureicoccus marinus TaxID=754435 RepID=A0A2S7T6V9_9FLAO|nr:hypothetical protein [Aureicoccus marinus]PQJ15321.1 hypothetical protein BST99_05835 [Aureicoccus marinus]